MFLYESVTVHCSVIQLARVHYSVKVHLSVIVSQVQCEFVFDLQQRHSSRECPGPTSVRPGWEDHAAPHCGHHLQHAGARSVSLSHASPFL